MNCSSANSEHPSSELIGFLEWNYYYFYSCTFSSLPAVGFGILVLWLVLLFALLGHTADTYFSPTLTNLCSRLKIPYDIAGVTLLALGNGAPDVFASISAFTSGQRNTAINALLGAAMFISTGVVGAVILASDTVHVSPRAMYRDILAFVIALITLSILGLLPHIFGSVAWVLPGVYASYVTVVVLGDLWASCRRKKVMKEVQSELGDAIVETENYDCKSEVSAFWHSGKPTARITGSTYAFTSKDDLMTDEQYEMSEPMIVPEHGETFSGNIVSDYFPNSELASPLLLTPSTDAEIVTRGFSQRPKLWESLYSSHLRWKRQTKRDVLKRLSDENRVFFKMLLLLEYPFTIMRDITIPVLDHESWSRFLATMHPVTCPMFLIWVGGYASYPVEVDILNATLPLWTFSLVIGILVSTLVFFTTHRSRPPTNWIYHVLFLSVAFAACTAWVFVIASEVVALIGVIGKITGISESVLGFTVLAWGNSVGDLVTNISIAKAGFPQMAIAGCFGGPLFNLLIGLGISMVIETHGAGNASLDLKLDQHAITAIVILLITLPLTLFTVARNGYQIPKQYGVVLILAYVFYTIINLIELLD